MAALRSLASRSFLASCLLLGAAAATPPVSAQVIPSAIPSIGKLLDIRDVTNITAGEGKLVLTASYVTQTASKFFAADGSRQKLSLDQTIRLQAVPLLATYGLTDRLDVGAGISVFNRLERKLSVLNFVPGASILGQPLTPGAVTSLELQGDGFGDLDLLVQYRPDWFDGRVQSLLTFDALAPTARANPSGPLDFPVGQGFWTYRLSYSAVKEIFPMTYFVKGGVNLNQSDTLADAAGKGYSFEPGKGFEYTGGASYAIGDSFSIQGLVVGSWRDQGVRSDQAAPTPYVRSLDFRPGYTFSRGDLTFTQQLAIPLSGANVLSAEGIMTTVQYRF